MTQKVKEFYETFPFPSKVIEARGNLYANAAWVSALAGRKPTEFKKGEHILEAGCGTGEFSCGFALGKARVLGIDISAASVERARALAKRFGLRNAEFRRADILHNNLPKESFDFIFSMGVLHHTENPRESFARLAELLKPGGVIAIGLYNRYGRIPVMLKAGAVRLLAGKDTEKRIKLANRLFHKNKHITPRRRIWLADKYAHPLEKTISVEETLRWFKVNKIEFLASKPDIPEGKSNLLVQFRWMLRGINFFSISGRKALLGGRRPEHCPKQ